MPVSSSSLSRANNENKKHSLKSSPNLVNTTRASASPARARSLSSQQPIALTVVNNEIITEHHQIYAATLILPVTTIGFFCMIFAFNFYLGHKIVDHLEYALWPSSAFATAWLLWHRYEVVGWRRNLDIVMTCTAIAMQTYNVMKKCECGVHVGSYLFASAFGIGMFIIGSLCAEFRTGMKWHLCCHLVAYVCNALLYRCISITVDK